MIDRAIVAAMGLATVVLVAIAYLSIFEGDDGPSGPPGSVQTDCNEMVFENRRSAARTDRYVVGVVQIGFIEGPEPPEASRLLRSTGTSYDIPLLPFRDFAIVCVEDGFEEEWVEKMRSYDWVEWAHRENGDPLLAGN